MNRAPIGIFDSGLGGLTVAHAIFERLPMDATIYFGDTARVPYGPKSADTVRRYSREIADWLLGQGIDGLALHGVRAAPGDALRDGDRIELLRPLVADPKDARRRRAAR